MCLDVGEELLNCAKTIEEIEARMQVLANALDSGPAKNGKKGSRSR